MQILTSFYILETAVYPSLYTSQIRVLLRRITDCVLAEMLGTKHICIFIVIETKLKPKKNQNIN